MAEGTHILGAARAAGLPLGAECGGFGKCRCCRVVPLAPAEGGRGAPAWLGCPNAAERRQLTPEELAAGWRLACQTPVRGDLAVLAPLPDDRPARKTIDTSLPVRLDPWAERLSLRVEAGEGREGGALMARALAALRLRKDSPGRPSVDVGLFPRLEPHLSRALTQKTPLTLTLVEGAVVDLEPGDTARKAYGAVIDIGTTHLYAYLIDLATGALLAEVGRPNSQRAWGADLMARVLAATPRAGGGGGAREELTRAVRRDVDQIITTLLRQSRVRKRHLVSLTFVGNSVMHHLFLGIPVESLGVAPYV
ncbi:MAG: 2Fe-2S iron-sulfur cluster-binding protein, partial [Nitrospinota bacterium]